MPLVRPLAQSFGHSPNQGLSPFALQSPPAGQSPASHPAAKPRKRTPALSGVDLEPTLRP
jgi:hypothetical protein